MRTSTSTAAFVLALIVPTSAHITLWHPSLFGFNYPLQATNPEQSWNSNGMVNPHRASDNLTMEEWFAHGAKMYPPAPGQFLELPAGESAVFELACNRAWTSYRDPAHKEPKPDYACRDDTGPLHTAQKIGQPLNASHFGGTALAIAYISDENKLYPENMTIISVNATSPWTREVTYRIPSGLPPCPPEGCLVTWNWLHLTLDQEGYGAEFYNTLYRAKITGKTDTHNEVPVGKVPVHCENNPSQCVKGPKVPMYLWQKTGNNMPAPSIGSQNPSYNARYGFVDGAQEDAVVPKSDTSTSTKSAALRFMPSAFALVPILAVLWL